MMSTIQRSGSMLPPFAAPVIGRPRTASITKHLGCTRRAGTATRWAATRWAATSGGHLVHDLVQTAGQLRRRGDHYFLVAQDVGCLLYTSDAADEEDSVDLG